MRVRRGMAAAKFDLDVNVGEVFDGAGRGRLVCGVR